MQVELNRVFYQKFNYEDSAPGLATAKTAAIFRQMDTEYAAYIEEVYKGSPLFQAIGEVQAVPLSTPAIRNKYTTYIKDYAAGIEISKDLFDDNHHGVWAGTVENFARMARTTQDSEAMGWYRGAFTTSLTADGVAFVSASHVLIGGGTLSNLVSGALTTTTLNDAIVALAQQKDQAGVIQGLRPATLLVPTALFKHATEIVDSELLADSGNNNVNVYSLKYGISVFQSPFLGAAAGGSDTAWFLLASVHGVTRFVRQGIQTSLRDWSMSNNRTYLYQANFREAVSAADYFGVVGSTGV